MKFLIDRCAGRRLAQWLIGQGHDVLLAADLGPDPGDEALLQKAVSEQRVLVTLDADFGVHIFRDARAHAGLVRLPDVPVTVRIEMLRELLGSFRDDLAGRRVLTVRADGCVRVSRSAGSAQD